MRGQRLRGHRTKWFLKKGAAAGPDAAKWSSAWGMGLIYGLALVQVVIVSGSLEVGGGFGRGEEVRQRTGQVLPSGFSVSGGNKVV